MEKNRFKKLSYIVALITGALLIITGCGSSNPTASETAEAPTAESLAGSYKSTIDMTSSLNDSMSVMLGEGYELDFQFESKITADMDLVLNDDNTFSLEMDYKSLQDSLTAAMDAEGEDLAKAILTALGNSEDELTDEYVEYLKEGVISSFSEESLGDTGKSSGTYELDGNKITFIGENSSMTANVDGDTIVYSEGWTDFTGDDSDIIFQRVE